LAGEVGVVERVEVDAIADLDREPGSGINSIAGWGFAACGKELIVEV